MCRLGQSGLLSRLLRIRLLSALLLSVPGLMLAGWYAYGAWATHISYNAACGVEEPLSPELFHLHLHDRLARDYRRLTMSGTSARGFPTLDLRLGNQELDSLRGRLPPTDGKNNYVSGYLSRANETHRVKVRYRGSKHWHWNYPQKSWKVRLEDGGFMDGHEVFNLVNIPDPLMFGEQVILDIAGDLGLLTPDYYPVQVTVNNAPLGLYFFASQPDEGLLRRGKRIPGSIFSGNGAPIDADTGVSSLWQSAEHWKKVATREGEKGKDKHLLEALLEVVNHGDQTAFHDFASTYLDLEKFAMFDAIDVLFGGNQHDFHQNHKLYFDHYKAKFEPIAWNFRGWRGPMVFNRTENPLLLRLKDLPEYLSLRNRIVYELVTGTASPDEVRSRAEAILQKIEPAQRADAYWDANRLLPGITRYYRQMVRPMNRERQALVLEARLSSFGRRARFLKERLESNGVNVKPFSIPRGSVGGPEGSERAIGFELEVSGAAGLRLESISGDWPDGCDADSWGLLSLRSGHAISIGHDPEGRLQSEVPLYPGNVLTDRLVHHPHHGKVRAEVEQRRYRFVFRHPGCYPNQLTLAVTNLATAQITSLVMPFIHGDSAKGPATEMGSALSPADGYDELAKIQCDFSYEAEPGHSSAHPWCYFEPESRSVTLGPGVVKVKETQVFGPETEVVIAPGTTIKLSKKVSLVFHGRLLAKGTRDEPIVITAKKKNWGGIVLQGAGTAGSALTNVYFELGTRPKIGLGHYPGMVNIHDTEDIRIEGCRFASNRKSDDMLHVTYVRGLTIESSTFSHCRMDCVDLEHCRKALLADLVITDAGDECLDLMGSKVKLSRSLLVRCRGNAISAGEETKVRVLDSLVADSGVGLLAKNASKGIVDGVLFWRNDVGVREVTVSPKYGKKSRVVTDVMHAVGSGEAIQSDDKRGARRVGSLVTQLAPEDLEVLRQEVLKLADWDELEARVEEFVEARGGR